jgi:hypothetical protein
MLDGTSYDMAGNERTAGDFLSVFFNFLEKTEFL